MTRRRMLVGAVRSVEIPVTVKGSRAVIKIYSDLRVEAQEPRVWYNMGLEPTIAMVSPSHPPLTHTHTHQPTQPGQSLLSSAHDLPHSIRIGVFIVS